MRIQHYKFKCGTCKKLIPLSEISTHDPTHKLIVIEKTKPFLLGVLLSASISLIVFGALTELVLVDDINNMIELCRGFVGV